MDIERQPALPHSVVRLPPKRTRLPRERLSRLHTRCHADSLRGTRSRGPFGNLVHTLAQTRDINKGIRQAGPRAPSRDWGIYDLGGMSLAPARRRRTSLESPGAAPRATRSARMTRRSQDVSVIFLCDPLPARRGAPRVGAAPAFSLLAARLRVAGRPGRLRRGPARPAGPLTSGLPRVICGFGVARLWPQARDWQAPRA